MRTGRSLTVCRSLLPGGGCLLPGRGEVSQHALRQTPPVNRMTDRCKNITLATTSLRPVNIIALEKYGKQLTVIKKCKIVTKLEKELNNKELTLYYCLVWTAVIININGLNCFDKVVAINHKSWTRNLGYKFGSYVTFLRCKRKVDVDAKSELGVSSTEAPWSE